MMKDLHVLNDQDHQLVVDGLKEVLNGLRGEVADLRGRLDVTLTDEEIRKVYEEASGQSLRPRDEHIVFTMARALILALKVKSYEL